MIPPTLQRNHGVLSKRSTILKKIERPAVWIRRHRGRGPTLARTVDWFEATTAGADFSHDKMAAIAMNKHWRSWIGWKDGAVLNSGCSVLLRIWFLGPGAACVGNSVVRAA